MDDKTLTTLITNLTRAIQNLENIRKTEIKYHSNNWTLTEQENKKGITEIAYKDINGAIHYNDCNCKYCMIRRATTQKTLR